MFRGLDKTFGNFEAKTKLQSSCCGENVLKMDDRCRDDWLICLEKFWAASLVAFSLNSLLQCPLQCQWSCILGSKSHKSIAHSWHRCQLLFQKWRSISLEYVCGAPRCYSKEFCLCLQGERWLDGPLQLWRDVGKPFKPQCCFHWLNNWGQSLLRRPSSPSSDLLFLLCWVLHNQGV